MPSPIQGTKHTAFKLRASKDFPSREFKVEFTTHGLSISKKGDRNEHHLRWRPLLGQMLLFQSTPFPDATASWRSFLIPLKSPMKDLKNKEVLFEFCDKGVQIDNVFWTWRTVLNTAIVGI